MPLGIDVKSLESGLALAAVLLLLSACSSHEPTRAAMVPQTVNGDYGYSDKALDATHYEVTYVSPRLRADVDSDADHGLEGEKQRVYEFALWRAAQLADSKGYPAFRVAQESRDVDVTVNRQRTVPPPYFRPWGYRHWPYGPYGYWPYGYGYGWPGYDTQTTASGRITVKLTVELLANAVPGAMDTAATLDRLRKAHGSDGYSS
ncbi:MAG: CC0125/CC1285 family lipoprotein [Dongiaceae bacterium]